MKHPSMPESCTAKLPRYGCLCCSVSENNSAYNVARRAEPACIATSYAKMKMLSARRAPAIGLIM